jgi:nucleoside-diphosphate-sugar epimerase
VRKIKNILVTGGCGYVGSRLVQLLVEKGYFVRVVDLQWFGNHISLSILESGRLEMIKKSISDIRQEDLSDIDAVIHLANIANDPSVELSPVLSWEVNTLDTAHLLQLCELQRIDRFLYASSGSVYGVSSEEKVHENIIPVPISAYNKTKMVAERICLSYSKNFDVICLRPATVCGYSPRMRFDVVVNMFVLQAFTESKITVLGGNQIRPNIHIEDMCEVYNFFLDTPKIKTGLFNAGFENLSVLEIARKVQRHFNCEIQIQESKDPRSYRQDSSKLIEFGFTPKKGVDDAIQELRGMFELGLIKDDLKWHTVKTMKTLGLG